MRLNRFFSFLSVGLLLSEVILIPLSWFIQSVWPLSGVRSLLSEEGVRWFMGGYADFMSTPVLSWLLLLAPAFGVCRSSGLISALSSNFHQLTGIHPAVLNPPSFRKRLARNAVIIELVAIAVIILLLTCLPHPTLASATGHFFPSSFSRALVPVVAFTMVLIGVTYGWATGRFRTIFQVFSALCTGYGWLSPLFILYITAAQFYFTMLFVFGA